MEILIEITFIAVISIIVMLVCMLGANAISLSISAGAKKREEFNNED